MPDGVLIIGGGLIGCSIAWRLAQRGRGVAIAEAGTLGGQASWAGAGMLAPGGEVERDSPWARHTIESLDLYPDFVGELRRETGMEIDYRECGALELAYNARELQAIEARAAAQSALGIESRAVTAAEALEFVPALAAGELLGARFYPRDAVVDPRDVMAALRVGLTRLRVEIREHAPVTNLPECGDVILAAGAWSSSLALNLRRSYPVKGHLIGYHLPPGTVPVILRHGHTYILQRSSGFTIAGSTTEDAGFDPRVDPEIVGRLHQRARRYLPGLLKTTPDESWIGFRPAVEGEEPQVGPGFRKGLWLAYGHYRNGILLAPWTAMRIANSILSSTV